MSDLPNCPDYQSEYTYEDGLLLICPEYAHEWSTNAGLDEDEQVTIRDANGNTLSESS